MVIEGSEESRGEEAVLSGESVVLRDPSGTADVIRSDIQGESFEVIIGEVILRGSGGRGRFRRDGDILRASGEEER